MHMPTWYWIVLVSLIRFYILFGNYGNYVGLARRTDDLNIVLTHISLGSFLLDISKHWRHISDATECGV